MKVRKLAVALALAGGLGSGVAQALGLGEIELQSYLNEPLDAEINLRKSQGTDPGDVFVNIASENDYQRVGIDRNLFLTKLQFEVSTSRDGSLIVNVTSKEPLREPYLNFLLEVTWPSGRLMREYSVLVDPPVYSEESGVQEQLSVPSTRSEPAARRQPFGVSGRAGDSRVTAGSGARTFGPTNSSDTLWQIAANVRPDDSVSMQQVMLAIQDLNPNAFLDGNINLLKRGEVLRLPQVDQIRSRSASEANRQVAAQNDAFSSPRRTVDATDATATPAATDAPTESGDELRLIAADDSASRSREDGGSAGGDGQTAGGADAGAAVAMEELESARRENDELNSRVDDLQDQVETLQRLLELKDSQLAQMQQMGSDGASGDENLAAGETEETGGAVPQDGMAGDESFMRDDGLAATEDSNASVAGTEPVQEPPEQDLSAQDGAAATEEESAAEQSAVGSVEEAIASEDDGAAAESREVEPVGQTPVAAEPEAPVQQPEKGFPGNIIDAITSNPMYQLALGGGLVLLLLLLLLLARRNANREKEFYEQYKGEDEGDDSTDSFDLSLDDEATVEAAADEPMAEAETYIAYGQMDKAAETLETAISREPSRSDLRLKLLGVYADTQDRGSFEKQFGEIEALDDDQAFAEATALRDRLEEAEAMPSIDDLESQLRSDSYSRDSQSAVASSSGEVEDFETDFSDLDLSDTALEETGRGDIGSAESGSEEIKPEETKPEEKSSDSDTIEYELASFETGSAEDDISAPAESASVGGETPDNKAESTDEDDFSFDFDVSELETGDETIGAESDADELGPEDFASLDTENDLTTETSAGDSKDEFASVGETADAGEDLGDLDESFLDELDAELDKVAGDDGDEPGTEESSLDDLELDVSDEDLALMEEFADSNDPEDRDSGVALDEELDLEDNLVDENRESPEELSAEAESLENLEGVDGLDEELTDLEVDESEASADAEPPLASDGLDKSTRLPLADELDESELGDDDDFDFLAGTDEAATKLDLARAYIEMGDVDGARDILEEVALEGDDEQKTEAQDLLKNLS